MKDKVRALRPLLFLIYLASMGVLCVLGAISYLGLKPSFLICFISMSIIFFVYLINYFSDIREDFSNDVETWAFTRDRKGMLVAGIIVIACAGAALIAVEKFSLYFLVLLAVGTAYSYRLIPWYSPSKGLVFYRLKEIPLIKNLVVAFFWGVSVFFVPVLFSGVTILDKMSILVLIGAMCVTTFVNTVFDDIRDVVGDRLAQSMTLPNLIGEKLTYILLGAVSIAWIGFISGLTLFGKLDLYHFSFMFIMSLYPLTYIIPHMLNKLSRPVIDFLSESDLLVYSSGLFILAML